MIVYTLGYSGWTVEQIADELERRDALLVDVRMSPRSRNPAYSGKRLAERFGERYMHIREFGNRNYRGGPIELADPEVGKLKLWAALVDSYRFSCILMCACSDVEVCHRKVVAEFLQARWGADIVHFFPPGQGLKARTLF